MIGSKPYFVEAGQVVCCLRPRLYWISWQLSATLENPRIFEHEHYHEVQFKIENKKLQSEVEHSTWLLAGCSFLGGPAGRVPTLVRWIPRKRPPALPKGLHLLGTAERDLWVASRYGIPPYQFQAHNLVRDRRGHHRVPNSSEREVLMDFALDHTMVACSSSHIKNHYRDSEVQRISLLGSSFQCGVVAWILQPFLEERGFLDRTFSVSEIRASLPILWAARSLQRPLAVDESFGAAVGRPVEVLLASAYIQRADHRGSDVRLASGALFRPDVWPRIPVTTSHWRWRTIIAFPFQFEAHINELEMRSALAALRWRLRRIAGLFKKYFHILDSMVSLAVINKKRSTSHKLTRVICRMNALELCSGCVGCYGFSRSHRNPGDKPSRLFDG